MFRVFIQSDSNPKKWHLVDLESYWGNGWCDCRDFQFRKEPELSDRGRRAVGEDSRCKHIQFARERIAHELLDVVMKERRKKKETSDEF